MSLRADFHAGPKVGEKVERFVEYWIKGEFRCRSTAAVGVRKAPM